MDLSLTTPALLFPTVSLLLLAYTNRFLTIAGTVRNLHDRYHQKHENQVLGQLKSLRLRLRLIRNMQFAGTLSLLGAVATMFLLYAQWQVQAEICFGLSLGLLIISLLLSAAEILISTRALGLLLSDLEELDRPSGSFLGIPLGKKEASKPAEEED